jgi:predicted dehydrogenase
MEASMDRRQLLGAAAGAGMALGIGTELPSARAQGANEKIVVGVIGTGGRGTALATVFQNQANVEVAYVCDVDRAHAERAAAAVAKVQGAKAPQVKPDLRWVLDDKDVDAVVVATCNHWHAPATILACAAGKHVYVEKPCSHNAREGELMIAAARKHDRRVQMGNQRRSWPKIQEAMQVVRSGELGRVYYAESWYTNNRPSIGRGKAGPPPAGLDYELWQGPAPRRPFKDNYLHYNWHWFWHWGNGELGNNGIHMIDLCRWGLNVDYPIHVTSIGGRYKWGDDQETPDTNTASFTFPDGKMIQWEGLSCNRMPTDYKVADVVFHGEKGTLAIDGGGYTVYDPAGKPLRKETGPGGEAVHIANFLDSIRGTAKLNSEIEEGHKSTLLCHVGNIAWRTSSALNCDPKDGKILKNKEALALWSRDYEKGWEPKV